MSPQTFSPPFKGYSTPLEEYTAKSTSESPGGAPTSSNSSSSSAWSVYSATFVFKRKYDYQKKKNFFSKMLAD